MEYDAHVAAVRQQGGELVLALSAGDPADPVPTCPDWTLHDLAVHVGGFCGFWTHVLCEGTGRDKPVVAEAPPGGGVAAWLDEQVLVLVEELEATSPATAVWTWYEPDGTAGFVARRGAHELTVHRVDAQQAATEPTPVPVELAADGVDEVLDVLVTARPPSELVERQRLLLRSTDTGLEWTVDLGPGRPEVVRSEEAVPDADDDNPGGEPDLVLTSSTSDLELALYGRPALDRIDVQGDPGVLARWYADFTF